MVPFLLGNPGHLCFPAVLEGHFHLFFPLQKAQGVLRDPEDLEGPSHLDGQEHRILFPLSVHSHQGLLAPPFLRESPWVLGHLLVPAVQVSLTQIFQLGQGFRVALEGPEVLVSQLGQYLLYVHEVLSPLACLAGLVRLASQWLIFLVVLASLALPGVQDSHSLAFLEVLRDLGVLEVQLGLVDQDCPAPL